MSPDKHLSRQDLIRIAREGSDPADPHLAACAECREAFELLAAFHRVAGRDPLPVPPPSLVKKAHQIARASSGLSRLVELAAQLIFDSWAAPAPVGVRGPAVEANRRVQFKAENLAFDLRAEKRESGWSFVAQCSGSDEPFVVQSDADVILPDNLGVYQWKANRPPAHIVLRSESRRVELPELKWKRTRPT